MEQLINDLKVKIIETLNLEGVAPDDIDEDSQLVGGELDIDSIDVLELVLMIRNWVQRFFHPLEQWLTISARKLRRCLPTMYN